MASIGSMRRWERWACGRTGASRARYAVSHLAKALHGDRSLWAASALARAARPPQPAAAEALQALIEACEDDKVVGDVLYQCLLQSGPRDDTDVAWSAVAAPVVLGGSPPRLVRFLEQTAAPDQVIAQLMMCVSFDSPRRPDLEEFLSSTDQPLILAALAKQWRDDTFLPNRIVTDVVMANPHIEPSGVLLAVAKDRADLLDLTQARTTDLLLRGTDLKRPDLAAKFHHVLRELPPGPARERLCELATYQGPSSVAAKAAIEAGYLPDGLEDQVLFLFLTEQWSQYDAIDPTGDLLYAAYVARRSADLRDHQLTTSILTTARRNHRPDPAVRYLEENPLPEPTDRPRTQSPGGYSSDYGFGGDHGAGGYHT